MVENLEKKSEQPKQKKGFTTSPTQEDLKPSHDEICILKKLLEDCEAAAKSQRVLGEPRRTFITAPTAEQLRPTPREQILLRNLCDWAEQSIKSLAYLEFNYNLSPNYVD
mgnify:CR=1 FL=1